MVIPFVEKPDAVGTETSFEFDFFISHATEDKESLVRPLAEALRDRRATVWYDEFELRLGDSIHEAISKGLQTSRAGIVVLSSDFFAKQWPKHELDGLMALSSVRPYRSIIPIWHGVTRADVVRFSPILAGVFGLASDGLSPDEIAKRILADTNLQSKSMGRARLVPEAHLASLDQLAQESFERWRRLTNGMPIYSPPRFPHGRFEVAIALAPTPKSISLNSVMERINEAGKIELTGWPPFMVSAIHEEEPRPYGEFVEAWLGHEMIDKTRKPSPPDNSDFWRASKDGMLYTVSGYSEDRDDATAGCEIFVELPILRVAEILLFAHRYAALFDGVEELGVRLRFTGLSGRKMTKTLGNLTVGKTTPSRSDEVTSHALIPCTMVENSLPDAVVTLLADLYEQFGFFELEMPLIQNEVSKLTSSRGMYN